MLFLQNKNNAAFSDSFMRERIMCINDPTVTSPGTRNLFLSMSGALVEFMYFSTMTGIRLGYLALIRADCSLRRYSGCCLNV